MNKQIKFYQAKAREMRDLARRSVEAALREKLNAVAEEYERLADEAGQTQT